MHPDREIPQPVGEVRPDPARRAGQLEPLYPPGQRAEHDAHLQPGQVNAEAQVRTAAAETEMPVGGAADIEDIRAGELGFVPVTRDVPEHHLVAGPDRRAAQFGVRGRRAAHEVRRAGPPEHLIGGRARRRRVGAQPVPLLRVLAERQDPLRDGDQGGLVPGDYEDREEVVEIDLAQPVAIDFRAQQGRQQVVARRAEPAGDELAAEVP
jgi:hypothetical protein